MQTRNIRRLHVFISCPGDVKDERRIVEETCGQLTETLRASKSTEIVPIHWEKDVVPVITGEGAQVIINEQIGRYDYDIYVGIAWTRFGDKQANGLTPTEEEFKLALDNYKKKKRPIIQFYFKRDKFCPNDVDQAQQMVEVLKFKERIRSLGISIDFEGEESFRKKMRDHLSKIVDNFDLLIAREPDVSRIVYCAPEPYLQRRACPREDYASGLYFRDRQAKDTLEIVSDSKRVALVSDAGTGKTTELKRIAAYFSKAESPFYPFLVTLNKYVDQSLSELLPSGWEEIPKSKIAVILDGLDEIESKNKRDAIRQIELFAEQHPKIHIVVSCRTNFYDSETEQLSGTLSGFSTYVLLELDEKEIEGYIKDSLDQKSDDFFKDVSNKRLYDLLKIPFYLVRLVELFSKSHALPSHKGEIFEQLLANRIEQDIEHYRTTIPLRQNQTTIFQTLQKLALGIEILGRNYISNDEYCRIIEEEPSRELIEHCTVWKKDDSEELKWQFEHNNFQEYLAARYLSNKSLSILKDLMFFEPDHRKLIPSWSNTLSFLISIRDDHDLIDWIIEKEPEVAVRFEIDRIETGTRINIFKRIFDHYKEKRIWINHDKFRYAELARFGQSDEIVEFLLAEIEKTEHYTTVSNAIKLLGHLEIPLDQRSHACELLVGCAVGEKFGDHVQNCALIALADLKLNDQNVVKKIVETLQASEKEWLRYGLYYFLHNSTYLDDNIDIFLNGLRYVRFDLSSTRSRLFDEHWHLRIGLEKATSPNSIMKIIKYFTDHPQDLSDTVLEKSISVIAENAVNAFRKELALYQMIKDLLEVLIENNLEEQASQLIVFFDKTKTRFEIFREYLSQEGNDTKRWSIVALVANTECIEFFVEQFEQRNIEDDDVLNFRNFLSWKNPDLYSTFNDLISARTDNKFPLPQERDYEKERKERAQRDFGLLFDREAFLDQIKLIFETENKESLTDREISDVQTARWNNPYFSDLAMRQLRNFAREGPVTYSNVAQTVNGWDWGWFCIFNVYEKLNHTEDTILTDEQKKWVENWCYTNLDRVNFRTALVTKSKDSSSSSSLAIFLWYFLRKFKLSYPKQVLLDLISYDWSEGGQYVGIEYIESLLSKQEMTTIVLNNLDEGIQNDHVLENHLDYGRRCKVSDVLPYALMELENSDREEGVRRIALDIICGLSSTFKSDLENALIQIQDDFKWNVIEKLLESDSDVCHEYLLTLLQTANEEGKLRSSQKLIELQDMEGLKYFVNWVRTNKKSPEQTHFEKSPLGSLCTLEAVPYLIELLKISYQPDFIKADYDYFGQVILDALAAIALQSDENYQSVRKATEDFVNENIGLIQHINFLNIFIEKLDLKFYTSKSKELNISDVVIKLKTVLGS